MAASLISITLHNITDKTLLPGVISSCLSTECTVVCVCLPSRWDYVISKEKKTAELVKLAICRDCSPPLTRADGDNYDGPRNESVGGEKGATLLLDIIKATTLATVRSIVILLLWRDILICAVKQPCN